MGAGWLYLFSNGITAGILMQIAEAGYLPRTLTQIPSAEAIVVLSGMLDQRPGLPLGEWTDSADRFEGGLDLLGAHKAPVVVFTGGAVPWQPQVKPEGDILKERAVHRGFSREKILVTRNAGNTAQEAEAVKELCDLLPAISSSPGFSALDLESKFRPTGCGKKHIHAQVGGTRSVVRKTRIILVTSAFHMRRAKRLFEQQGFAVEPFPVDFQSASFASTPSDQVLKLLPRAQFLARSELAFRELLGRVYYGLRALFEPLYAKA